MSQVLPDDKLCVLLVEGNDEKQFFIEFGKYLGVLEQIHIVEYGGATKENIVDGLLSIMASPNFSQFKHIGIVRDADFKDGAFDSTVEAIQSANKEMQNLGNQSQLPVPEKVFEHYGDKPKTSILILPDETRQGMLETVILDALREVQETELPIMSCVDTYFECLANIAIEAKPQPVPKAKMRVYMAGVHQSQMRAYIEGRNVDENAKRKDRRHSYLSDIYGMTWWSREKLAFSKIKDYLLQLVSEDSE